MEKDDEGYEGVWRTINGAHVFIRHGESPEDAIDRLSGKTGSEYAVVEKYGGMAKRVINASDYGYYESLGWALSDRNPKFLQALKDLDEIDPSSKIQYIIQQFKNRASGLPTDVRTFLWKQLNERLAEYEGRSAEQFLSNVPKLVGTHLMAEGEAMETNPNYEHSYKLLSEFSHEPEAAAYTMNCQRCVQAFVLRWCHGYDVIAKPAERIWDEDLYRFKKTLKEFEFSDIASSGIDQILTNVYGHERIYTNWNALIFNEGDVAKNYIDAFQIEREIGYAGTEDQFRWIKRRLKSDGPGACYIVTICWKGTKTQWKNYDAHTFCVINDNGKVKCIDPQTGMECSEYFLKKQIKSNKTALFRADTCRLNGRVMKEIVDYDE